MFEFKLFTDGSVDVHTKTGFGAYLIIGKNEPVNMELKNSVKTGKFENTSSTKLELQTLLWALEETGVTSVTIYTDSQNLLSLLKRRERLEANNYTSRNDKQIINAELYKEFYCKIDSIDCEFIKVKGHKRKHEKTEIDKIFTMVDRASRKALRRESEK